MKVKKLFPELGLVGLLILGFSSCNEEFSTLDTDIINGNFSRLDSSFSVKAYSKLLGPVQTNNQQTYKLGMYYDPLYGTSVVDFLGQLEMSSNSPTFPVDTLNPVLEKVILTMPFYSDSDQDSDGNTVYTLDSIYGSTPINVGVYESNYFLRDFDPNTNFEENQLYYSNQGTTFQDNLGALLLQKDNFIPSNLETEFIIEGLDTLNIAPGFNVELPTAFFQEKIIDQEGQEVLINNNNFKEYFRGIFFKVSGIEQEGSLFMFDPENAKITLYYSSDTTTLDDNGNQTTDDDGEIVRVLDSYDLTFTGINVNAYQNNLPASIVAALSNPNTTDGEETLYLQGGEGIATIIDLFGGDDNQNGIDDLQELREKNWLINEANLIMYVDQSKVTGGSKEPERIMIFDTRNNSILADYNIDLTSNQSPINAITQHLGRLERGSDGNGDYYKIKITSHVSNLINRDSSNVSLGVVVSQNVSYVRFFNLKNEALEGSFDEVPGGCTVSPEGTALHGNRSSDPDKRLKLQLFYTEPD
jgi:Domain of unknown function (DUF4270)